MKLAEAWNNLVERGFVKQVTDESGLQKALAAQALSYYVGFDPTGPSLHIGHLVPMFAMVHLARAGHKPIALIGGGTASIGDPSGKTEMRKMLSYEDLDKNAQSIQKQIEAFFQRCGVRDQVIIANNRDWLAKLNYIDFLRDVGVHFSVNRMLSFETYKQRMETGLNFIEFNYQLLQSYDFLVLVQKYGCRLQMGGDDQWGNIVAGTDLIRRYLGGEGRAPEVFGLTFPLITRSDGKKMGKTEKGSLFLDEAMTPALDIYQYFRNIPDADVAGFLRTFTLLPLAELEELSKAEGAGINVAKERLAFEFVQLIHGPEKADACRQGARAAFGGEGAGLDSLPTLTLQPEQVKALTEGQLGIVDLLVDSQLAPSRGEAKRLIQQGGISIGSKKIESLDSRLDLALWQECMESDTSLLLRAGKKKVQRLVKP